MKKLALILTTAALALSLAAAPALAEEAKLSPELDDTANVPVDGDMNSKPGDTDDGTVTSPDTGDSFAYVIGGLAAADCALIALYLTKKKAK